MCSQQLRSFASGMTSTTRSKPEDKVEASISSLIRPQRSKLIAGVRHFGLPWASPHLPHHLAPLRTSIHPSAPSGCCCVTWCHFRCYFIFSQWALLGFIALLRTPFFFLAQLWMSLCPPAPQRVLLCYFSLLKMSLHQPPQLRTSLPHRLLVVLLLFPFCFTPRSSYTAIQDHLLTLFCTSGAERGRGSSTEVPDHTSY